jgi:hypothetical protein
MRTFNPLNRLHRKPIRQPAGSISAIMARKNTGKSQHGADPESATHVDEFFIFFFTNWTVRPVPAPSRIWGNARMILQLPSGCMGQV